jgi:hypothetical protein
MNAAMHPAAARANPPRDVRLRDSLPPWLLALFALIALTLVAVPQVDIAASRLFADVAGGFPLADDRVLRVLNRAITWASRVAGVLLFVLAIVAWLPRIAPPRLAARKRVVLFLLVAMALGPGVLVRSTLRSSAATLGSRARSSRPINARAIARSSAGT